MLFIFLIMYKALLANIDTHDWFVINEFIAVFGRNNTSSD